jgi:micrococcal nuclease
VSWDRIARASLLAVLAASSSGCLGFGGPLLVETGDEDGEESDSSSDSTDGGSETSPDQHHCGPTSAVVDHVLDGDTIVLESGERVRYILVDTPELSTDDCWAQEATLYNEMLVAGRTITIEYDQECEDIYGRLLAYVSVDDVEVNRKLLELGFACFLHIPPNGDDRWPEYQALETAAKQDGVGMWGACATVACD